MRTLLSFVGFLLISMLSVAQAQQVPEPPGQPVPEPSKTIAGFYLCRGQIPDGGEYQGLVEIVELGSTFRIRWTIGNVQAIGVGILSHGVFATSYFTGSPTITVYKVDDGNNRLIGEWTAGGIDGRVYAEILTRIEHPQIPESDSQPDPPTPPLKKVPARTNII